MFDQNFKKWDSPFWYFSWPVSRANPKILVPYVIVGKFMLSIYNLTSLLLEYTVYYIQYIIYFTHLLRVNASIYSSYLKFNWGFRIWIWPVKIAAMLTHLIVSPNVMLLIAPASVNVYEKILNALTVGTISDSRSLIYYDLNFISHEFI